MKLIAKHILAPSNNENSPWVMVRKPVWFRVKGLRLKNQ